MSPSLITSAAAPETSDREAVDAWRPPATQLPAWGHADLPEPTVLAWSKWRSLLGPGIVMMGVQIGAGEWLFGPEITARYGGALMWLASVAIVLQVFYNLEVGRYALYCGEPIFTGFLRTKPGPRFWIPFFMLLSLGAMVPGLAFHAAAVLTTLIQGSTPTENDRAFVVGVAFACTIVAFLPVLFGRKIYNTLQLIMTVKVFTVLSFCVVVSLLLVDHRVWTSIFGGFLRFGSIPSPDAPRGETTVNLLMHRLRTGSFPSIGLEEIAAIGGFIGFAGGGGLGNSLYGNYVRDKGWGNGAHVGAIPSVFGGHTVVLSHLGKIFPATTENLRRWQGWWRVLLIDQVGIWAPGCFVGMALPALLSMQFAPHGRGAEASGAQTQRPAHASSSPADSAAATQSSDKFRWGAAMITAEGMRRDARLTAEQGQALWAAMLVAGLLVLLPSQVSVVDEICRRWTDVLWSASPHVRANMRGGEVKRIYYAIAACYFLWCLGTLSLFGAYGTPRLMTLVIGNLGNLAMGITAFHILWINCRWLPPPVRPSWPARCGLAACGAFYLAAASLVFAVSVAGT